tara:strand:+ start:4988 stop:6292 length:1305 start_codon:yes stop_codon:yes gene_type:complete
MTSLISLGFMYVVLVSTCIVVHVVKQGSEYILFSCYVFFALYAYFYQKRYYAPFVVGLWVLTPFIRRYVDYYTGYDPASLIILSPYMVSLIGLYSVLPRLLKTNMKYAVIVVVVITYFFVGVFVNGIFSALWDFFGYIAPISFSLWIILYLRGQSISVLVNSILILSIIVSVYAIFQFFFLPSWDAMWMIRSEMMSIGLPEPTSVRVFSMMNSPAVLASFLTLGIALSLGFGKGGYNISLFFLVVLMTSVRVSWGVAFILFLSYSLFSRKIISSFFIVLLGAFLILSINDFLPREISELISNRLESIENISDDHSMNERLYLYQSVVNQLTVYGQGFGSVGASSGENIDSGYLELFINFGIFGGCLYIIYFLFLLMKAFVLVGFNRLSIPVVFGSLVVPISVFDSYMYGPYGCFHFLAIAIAISYILTERKYED